MPMKSLSSRDRLSFLEGQTSGTEAAGTVARLQQMRWSLGVQSFEDELPIWGSNPVIQQPGVYYPGADITPKLSE